MSGTVEAAYLPIDLRQHVNYTQYRGGDNLFGARDTGYAVTWNQSVAFAPIPLWNITGESRWRRTEIAGESNTSTFLVSAQSNIEQTRSGFTSRQEYRINRELAARFEQRMFFVGRGLGTHAFDTTANEFRPSANGDHIIQEVAIYDNTTTATVRKTMLNGDWHFRPRRNLRGILNDLTWSGVLSLEEHVDSRNENMMTYLPGFLSLFPSNKNRDDINGNANIDAPDTYNTSHPTFADLTYRQDIDHRIQGSLYRSRLHFNTGLRIVRDHREPMFRTGLLVERKKNSLTLSVEPHYLSVRREHAGGASAHNNTSAIYDLRELGAEFIQSITPRENVELYIRERVGHISDESLSSTSSLTSSSSSITTTSSTYFQIRPGIVYRPTRGGAAELSYTFSHLPWTGATDHRIANGATRGTSHVITFISDINAGKFFNLSGLYRGELLRRPNENQYAPMTHVFSMTVKAFL